MTEGATRWLLMTSIKRNGCTSYWVSVMITWCVSALAPPYSNMTNTRARCAAGAVQWSDTVSSFATCAAYIILVSVFLLTAAALYVEVTRDHKPALQQPLVTSPSASPAQLLSRLSLQVA